MYALLGDSRGLPGCIALLGIGVGLCFTTMPIPGIGFDWSVPSGIALGIPTLPLDGDSRIMVCFWLVIAGFGRPGICCPRAALALGLCFTTIPMPGIGLDWSVPSGTALGVPILPLEGDSRIIVCSWLVTAGFGRPGKCCPRAALALGLCFTTIPMPGIGLDWSVPSGIALGVPILPLDGDSRPRFRGMARIITAPMTTPTTTPPAMYPTVSHGKGGEGTVVVKMPSMPTRGSHSIFAPCGKVI